MSQQQTTPQPQEMASSDYYFDSYSHFGIHEEMLKDEVRTLSYRNAILRNRRLFEGKVVLDVGCGTGILSMFAAQAGAKLVIGVDMSGMLEHAKKIVAANDLSDRIVLLRGKMEEVQLPVEKVDIIISEWMGYALLYESMLDTVLWARDRYLVEGGLLFPDRCSIMLTAIEDAEYKEQKIHYWDDVYGFDMSCMKEWVLREPLVDTVEGKAVVASADCSVFDLDLNTITVPELAFKRNFAIQIGRTDTVHALLVYFTTSFTARDDPAAKHVHFSTGPADKYTHWKQSVFYLPKDLSVDAGDVIRGTFTCTPNERNRRDLDFEIVYEQVKREGAIVATGCMKYHMA